MNIEFFWTSQKTRLMVQNLDTEMVEPFGDKQSLIRRLDARIHELYPDTFAELCRLYGSGEAVAFSRVNRFLKCNFSVHDHRPDLDDDMNFELELVPCPLRGECKNEICNPRLGTDVSEREKQVILLHAEGFSQLEIGNRLYISERTVHNHFTNIYKKLGLTGSTCPEKKLINYAYKHKLI